MRHSLQEEKKCVRVRGTRKTGFIPKIARLHRTSSFNVLDIILAALAGQRDLPWDVFEGSCFTFNRISQLAVVRLMEFQKEEGGSGERLLTRGNW